MSLQCWPTAYTVSHQHRRLRTANAKLSQQNKFCVYPGQDANTLLLIGRLAGLKPYETTLSKFLSGEITFVALSGQEDFTHVCAKSAGEAFTGVFGRI